MSVFFLLLNFLPKGIKAYGAIEIFDTGESENTFVLPVENQTHSASLWKQLIEQESRENWTEVSKKMMRKRSFLALTLFWTFYVWVVGGLALSNLESPSKCSELSKCNEGLINVPSTNDTQTMCRDMEKCYDWSAVNSTFVAFTAMTTIGKQKAHFLLTILSVPL